MCLCGKRDMIRLVSILANIWHSDEIKLNTKKRSKYTRSLDKHHNALNFAKIFEIVNVNEKKKKKIIKTVKQVASK